MEFLLTKKSKSTNGIKNKKSEIKKLKLLNPSKYFGILKLDEDPMSIQKRLRNE